jgi:hypothetical protein
MALILALVLIVAAIPSTARAVTVEVLRKLPQGYTYKNELSGGSRFSDNLAIPV